MEFQELERHVDVDCKHRLVFCKQDCGIKLKYKDQNKHCQLECIKRIVRCKQGCGKEMMFEELKEGMDVIIMTIMNDMTKCIECL